MKLRWSLHLPEGQVDSLAVNPGVVLEWRRQKAEQMLKDETQGASEEQSIRKEPFSPSDARTPSAGASSALEHLREARELDGPPRVPAGCQRPRTTVTHSFQGSLAFSKIKTSLITVLSIEQTLGISRGLHKQ